MSKEKLIRKNIDLSEDVIERLEVLAKNDSRKLKPFIELSLINLSKKVKIKDAKQD